MTDIKSILQPEEELNQKELIRYLEGTASAEERFAVEKQMADSSFVNDAVEGLQHIADPDKLAEYAEQLNRQLQKHTGKKQARKNKRQLKEQSWLIISILAILLLCVAGYLLIHFLTIK